MRRGHSAGASCPQGIKTSERKPAAFGCGLSPPVSRPGSSARLLIETGQFVDRFEPFERFQRHAGFKFRAVLFSLCRHLAAPSAPLFDTAFYLHDLSSFRGTLYHPAIGVALKLLD